MPQTDPRIRCQRCSCAVRVIVDGKPYCGMCRTFTPYVVTKKDASDRPVRRYHDAKTSPYAPGHGFLRSATARELLCTFIVPVLITALTLLAVFAGRA